MKIQSLLTAAVLASLATLTGSVAFAQTGAVSGASSYYAGSSQAQVKLASCDGCDAGCDTCQPKCDAGGGCL
ncbi:MAG: hypothetical protein J5I93_16130 [Pirellulaceae bacterium]|nr:hypothetical protein [Pirellulaceae bacterium]